MTIIYWLVVGPGTLWWVVFTWRHGGRHRPPALAVIAVLFVGCCVLPIMDAVMPGPSRRSIGHVPLIVLGLVWAGTHCLAGYGFLRVVAGLGLAVRDRAYRAVGREPPVGARRGRGKKRASARSTVAASSSRPDGPEGMLRGHYYRWPDRNK